MSSTIADVLSALVRATGGMKTLALIGAVARNAWAPPRATTDIDLAVAASSEVLQAISRELGDLGYQQTRSHRADPADPIADLVVFRTFGGALRQVDLLVAKTPFEEQVLERATRIEIAGVAMPVATPEDLIIYKLVADRPRDRDDIEVILRTQTRAGRVLDWDHMETWARFWSVSDRLAALARGNR